MSWNHRVIKSVHKGTLSTGEPYEEEMYAIHEVHYRNKKDDTPCAMTVEPVAPVGESMEALRWTLERMLEALDTPVLTDEDFKNAPPLFDPEELKNARPLAEVMAEIEAEEAAEKPERLGQGLSWDALGPEGAP